VSLLICGNTVVDLIFPRVAQLPQRAAHTEFTLQNLTFAGTPPLVTIGGNGANAAYVAARCGAAVLLRSNIGRDAFGGMARTWLTGSGCRIENPPGRGHTAVNVTAADTRMRRATLFYPGVPPKLPRGSGRGLKHALVCGWPHPPWPALARRLSAWRSAGTRTAFDAGPILGRPPALRELLGVFAALDLLLLNRHEAQTITGTRTPAAAAGALRRVFAGDLVVKLGPDGALWLPAGLAVPRPVPGLRIQVTNTVGAGDTFNGALLAALAQGCAFPDALRLANATAASVVRSSRGVLGVRPPRGSLK
jgi:ribokinase